MKLRKLASILAMISLLMLALAATTIVVGAQETDPTETPPEVTVAATDVVTPTVAATDVVTPTVAATDVVTPTSEPPTDPPTVDPTDPPPADPTDPPTVDPTDPPPGRTDVPAEAATPEPVEAPASELGAQGEIGAQANIGKITSIVYVQDVSGAQNDIAVKWLNPDGSEAASPTFATLNGYGEGVYTFPGSSPFLGSAIVESVGQVRASVKNTDQPTSSETGKTAGYVGSDTGAQFVFLPVLHRSNWESLVAVQNMKTTTSADITFRIYDSAGTEVLSKINTIPAEGTQFYDLTDAAFSALGTSFGGSGTVESDQDVYVAVQEVWAPTGSFIAYEGFTQDDASTTLFVPAFNRNQDNGADGWNGALYVQNGDPTNSANVNITYKDSGGGTAKTLTNINIAPYAVYYISAASEPTNRNNWAGSVVVESTGGEPLVGNARFVWANSTGRANYGMYAMPSASVAGKLISAPLVHGNQSGGKASGFNTQFYVQNTNLATASDVTITYYNKDGTVAYIHNMVAGPGSTAYTSIAGKPALYNNFEGSAMIETSQDSVVVQVDQGLGGKEDQAGFPTDPMAAFTLPAAD